MLRNIVLANSLLGLTSAWSVGTNTPEVHPPMNWQRCTAGGSCTNVPGKVVLDSNWRWLHNVGGFKNCYDGNIWDATLCPNNAQCTTNCAIEGADYAGTYGISATGNSLRIKFVNKHQYGTNVGGRVYLMENDNKYQLFNLLNSEFTFDVDVSQLPCGLNGALYFISMDADGGTSKYPTNKAGAKYGTGYCDAQCPRDIKLINGQANAEGWKSSSSDKSAGVGKYGTCCAEMDIWEANSISTAFTPHSCQPVGQARCEGDACGGTYSATRYAGNCDPDGCDFNSFRMGNTSFYGPGKIVDTTKPVTVVTQFLGNPLREIKRFYVQNGVVIPNSVSNIAGVTGNSITTEFCDASKAAFGDVDPFKRLGGMANMGEALGKGMVLAMSLWNDHYANMLWLDSTYPIDKTAPGGPRGTCPTDGGKPAQTEAQYPNAQVVFSNIKFGPLGSTFKQPAGT